MDPVLPLELFDCHILLYCDPTTLNVFLVTNHHFHQLFQQEAFIHSLCEGQGLVNANNWNAFVRLYHIKNLSMQTFQYLSANECALRASIEGRLDILREASARGSCIQAKCLKTAYEQGTGDPAVFEFICHEMKNRNQTELLKEVRSVVKKATIGGQVNVLQCLQDANLLSHAIVRLALTYYSRASPVCSVDYLLSIIPVNELLKSTSGVWTIIHVFAGDARFLPHLKVILGQLPYYEVYKLVNRKMQNGDTALDIAKRKRLADTVEFLRLCGE